MKEIDEKVFSPDEDYEESEEEKEEMRRVRCEIKLIEYNTNVNEQRKYFEIMKGNDMPIGNGIFTVERAIDVIGKEDSKIDIIAIIQEWEDINTKYQAIEMQDQDENTGKSIILEMKELIPELLEQLKVWRENPNELPKNLKEIIGKIKNCGQNFVKLPAYIAYRDVGMHELNSDRLKSKDKK